jgi:AraC-like DNA-binding protein
VTPDLVPFPANLLERLARLGVDVDRLLRLAEIARSRFGVPRPQGTTAELFALWRAAEEIGGRDLGLRTGSETLPHHQNIASLAALHSPTLGEGLAKLARYKRLVCPEEITIDVRRGEARVRFEWVLADSDPPPMLIDGIFAGVLGIAQRGTGKPIRPRRLELTRRRAHEPMLRKHFGCDIRFDAPFDAIVLDETLLALPLVTHNAQLLALIVPGLESALEQEGSSRSLADDVRTALGQTICGERPAVEKVAKSLGMSPRTLQRRLGEIGTTYQKLLDGVRHRSARRFLANTDLGVGEVAFLLGFEELNSFTRAFHSWEGTTPARWRATASR